MMVDLAFGLNYSFPLFRSPVKEPNSSVMKIPSKKDEEDQTKIGKSED